MLKSEAADYESLEAGQQKTFGQCLNCVKHPGLACSTHLGGSDIHGVMCSCRIDPCSFDMVPGSFRGVCISLCSGVWGVEALPPILVIQALKGLYVALFCSLVMFPERWEHWSSDSEGFWGCTSGIVWGC